MQRIWIVSESPIPPFVLLVYARVLSYFANWVAKIWGYKPIVVLPSSRLLLAANPLPAGDWIVFLTERNAKPDKRILGFHTVENGNPVAYCSPARSPKPFGKYYAPWFVKGRLVLNARFRSGLITVICHEVAEMIVDGYLNNESGNAPLSTPDKLGRKWKMEIADPVAQNLFHYFDPDSKTECVLPDVVFPGFYSTDGVAPFDLLHVLSAPFTLAPGGYAYADINGREVKI